MQESIGKLFALKENEGDNKILPLHEAIKRYVNPGMSISVMPECNPAMLELCRCFWGTKPRFTLIGLAVAIYSIIPVHGGLVKKIITSNSSHPFPKPGPISILQKAVLGGEVEVENWSLCSIEQRLMAGVYGWNFVPTHSISGTTMAEENRDAYAEIDDPFGGGKVPVIKSLIPDVSLVHGIVADRYGNTIPRSPYQELWGQRAGRKMIVTVEKVVSTDYIRRHSSMVKIPGYLVSSVTEAPVGAHPMGIYNPGLEGVRGYNVDYDFHIRFRKAAESSSFSDWVKEWVLDLPDHNAYLNKLGKARIAALKEKESGISLPRQQQPGGYTRAETQVVAVAHKLKEKIVKGRYKVVLAGIGMSALAAFLAYYFLRRENYHIDLAMGTGEFGCSPRPGASHSILDTSHFANAKVFTDTLEMFSMIIGGRENRALSCLGAAEIDRMGNINTTRISGRPFIGTGGANDAANSRESIVVARHTREHFVEKVPYISTPGERVSMVVTDLGILEKEGGELVLTGLLPRGKQDRSRDELVDTVRNRTGWSLKVRPILEEVSPPTGEEILALRALDPDRFYINDAMELTG